MQPVFEALDPAGVASLLEELVELTREETLQRGRSAVDRSLQAVINGLLQWRQNQGPDVSPDDRDRWQPALEELYQWVPPDSATRNLILAWWGLEGTVAPASDTALRLWAESICQSPGEHRASLSLAFGPLMNRDFEPPHWLLEKLLREAMVHSQLAPAVFDLFNFYVRVGKLSEHPAASRISELASLVEKLSDSLAAIERGEGNPDPVQRGQQVADSVAMLVAVCDTLALLEAREAIPALERALALRHRRVQTEAAAALARMGVPAGREALRQLAEEPVCRLRVLAFARELGMENEISLELRGEIARAEAELALWLSEPSQVGLAPSQVMLVDQRELYWPSYEEPVVCYLFRYEYGSGDAGTANLGIVGPLTYAFPADLTVLSHTDAFAVFAGWQTVHPDSFQVAADRASELFPNDWQHLQKQLESSGMEQVTVQTGVSFFGKLALVATGRLAGEGESIAGTLIATREDSTFVPSGNPQAPLSWELAVSLWQGRQLLDTFNPDGGFAVSNRGPDSL